MKKSRCFGFSRMSSLLLAGCLALGIAFPATSAAADTKAAVTVYGMPSNLPSQYKSTDFTVTAGGQSVPVYASGANAWGSTVSYATFDASEAVSVSIGVNFSFTQYQLIPNSLGIAGTRSGSQVNFTVQPDTDVTLLLDGNYNGRVLHLFVRSPEEDVPSVKDSNVVTYAPGYYDLSSQTPVQLSSGQTLYLAGGAVVRGRVLVNNAQNVTIRGRGILLNDFSSNDGYDNVALALKNSDEVHVKDLLVARNMNSWTAFMWKCSNVDVVGFKAINAKYASSDGFDIANSHDVLFDHVFVRSCDDSVAVKGTGDAGYNASEDPADTPPTYHVTYQNSQLWSDSNNAIGIGAETLAEYFDNIDFNNIDILRNYDDLNYPDQLTDRSAVNICALNATTIQNVTFENIRVGKAKRLIGICMVDSFWFGSLSGNWRWPGVIQNIHYKNIESDSDGSNEIRIYGKDASHLIRNVTLENVKINGNDVSRFSDPHFNVNSFVKEIHIVSPDTPEGITSDGPILPASLNNAATQFSQVQGGNNWNYRVWQAGVGTSDMTWNPDGSGHWRGTGQWDAIWTDGNQVYLHPDATQVMLEWTAPRSGTVNISGNVHKSDTGGGDGITASVWKNNQMIWPANGQWQHVLYNDTTGYSTAVSTTVAQGDILSFRVDKYGNNAYDSTVWTPAVSYED